MPASEWLIRTEPVATCRSLVAALLCALTSTGLAQVTTTQWVPVDIPLRADRPHAWWTFPVESVFTHTETGTQRRIGAFHDGDRTFVLRFAPPLPGEWQYRTRSSDGSLNDRSGTLQVRKPTPAEMSRNPNLRGQVKISANGRYFEYADGTPTFILADTIWAANTARCGLGPREDGPFFQYLADREAKGFSALLMEYMRGFGDTNTEVAGQRNEGGYPFFDNEVERLNPAYFRSLDRRIQAISERGFLLAIPTTWFGKMRNCFFDLPWAKRISAYLATRFGAYNSLWAISGEYQYVFADCHWTADDLSAIGATLQQHNPYQHPLSIHPSGRTAGWKPPHNVQSSKPFHDRAWLDHHWLQTGQSIDRMHNIVTRCRENRALRPAKPVFCAESYYEITPRIDPDAAYHARWEAWTAFLSGAAGYGYGAWGLWQFYDPNDPNGETGKKRRADITTPWYETMQFRGADQMRHVRTLLTSFAWWKLQPHREWITVDGESNPLPTKSDLTPPQVATDGRTCIAYIPRGNKHRRLRITHLETVTYRAAWYSPRSGVNIAVRSPAPSGVREWLVPDRPAPANEDWVLVLETTRRAEDSRFGIPAPR